MNINNLVNVADYGAIGDGVNNDYDAILSACREINKLGSGTLYFPPGIYNIDEHRIDNGVNKNNIKNFKLSNCTRLNIEGNNSLLSFHGNWTREVDYENRGLTYSYHNAIGFEINNCIDVVVKNIELNGNCDKTIKKATAEGRSSGLIVSGCTNVIIEGVKIHHYHADGLYVNSRNNINEGRKQTKKIKVINSKFTHNARQACSLIQLRQGIFINCLFSSSGITGLYGGHAPQAGVDIEPNYEGDQVDDSTGDISFIRCMFEDNVGFPYVGTSYTSTQYPIRFYSCTFKSEPNRRNSIVVPLTRETSFKGCSFIETRLEPNHSLGEDVRLEVLVDGCLFENSTPEESVILISGFSLPKITIMNSCFYFKGQRPSHNKYRIYLQGNTHTAFQDNYIWISKNEFPHGNNKILKFLVQGGITVSNNLWSTDLDSTDSSFCISYAGSVVSDETYFPSYGFCLL